MKTPFASDGRGCPKVSVLMLTYNHQRYLADAIESVLKQEISFEIELLIGDDCSSDGTYLIAASYKRQNPTVIQVFRANSNRGMCDNFLNLLAHSRGEYIAFLEGDDFWLHPDKLQRQVAFLEANPKCSLTFHQVRLVRHDGSFTGAVFPTASKQWVTLNDIIEENQIPTASVVFRRSALRAVPGWCRKVRVLDWPLFMLITKSGPAAFFDEPMAAYRLHAAGAWSALPAAEKSHQLVEMLHYTRGHFMYPVQRWKIRQTLANLHSHIAWCVEDAGNTQKAIRYAWRAAALVPTGRRIKKLIRLTLNAAFPWLASLWGHRGSGGLRHVTLRIHRTSNERSSPSQ